MPPLDGPRAMLCVTRYPSKTCVDPSSMLTGIETATAFLHFSRTLTRLGSIANVRATLRSWAFAMSYGFSRRWVSGASTVVTLNSFFRAKKAFSLPRKRTLLDRERDRASSRRSSHRRVSGEPQDVVSRRQDAARGVAAGDAERVAAREHVAQP